MLSRTLVLLPVCLVLAVGSAQSGDKKEQERLEGTWTIVDMKGGKDKHEIKDGKAIYKGDHLTVKSGDKVFFEAKYTVDPSKKPGTMDLAMEKEGKKMTMLGVYKLDGDNLKVAHYADDAKAAKERPNEVAASDDVMMVTLKRDKK